jgi:GR25 family glycosyltransferase involved in LPS biosynthesis
VAGPRAKKSAPKTPAFVINLDSRPDRLAEFTAMAASLNLSFRRISAVDARKIDAGPLADWWRTYLYNDFSAPQIGQVGVLASHRKVWQTIVDENLPQALVFEDDAIPGDFDGRFLSLSLKDLGLEQLRLEEVPCEEEIPTLYKFDIAAPVAALDRKVVFQPSFGAAAYIITQEGARKCLAAGKFWFNMDHFDCWAHVAGLRTGLLQPTIFKQSASPTSNSWVDLAGMRLIKSQATRADAPLPVSQKLMRLALVHSQLPSILPWRWRRGARNWLMRD